MPSDSRQLRRRLGLGALALPIVAMMGLFAWAGTEGSPTPVTAVSSFISAYDGGDCQVMLGELYQPPGQAKTRCSDLVRSGRQELASCKLSVSPATSPSSTSLPVGYSDAQTILARCRQISVDFFVATDDSSGNETILGLSVLP